jgi:hypothetical protein
MGHESLRSEIEGGRRAFSPGDTLAGQATWTVDDDPTSAELRLFWYTAGKGTQNLGIVTTQTFDQPRRQDRRDFRMAVPRAPYSCSGKLVSIVWALELIVEPGGRTGRVDLTIAPGGQEVILAQTT